VGSDDHALATHRVGFRRRGVTLGASSRLARLVSGLLHSRSMRELATPEPTLSEDYWADLNRDILDCLEKGPVAPAEIGRRLGMSESAAASCLALLIAEGRVRICLVERVPPRA
jgi:hypothetical protein